MLTYEKNEAIASDTEREEDGMKLKEVIENVNELKENAFSEKTLTRWINALEGRIQTEVFLFGPNNITKYTWENNQETDLFVKEPYEEIYEDYLLARIDLANGEYDKYANSLAKFEEVFTAFTAWFIMKYHPADTPYGGKCECEG